MSHERSVTVKRDGRYYVLDNSGKNKGAVLGPSTGFGERKAADSYARKRSAEAGRLEQDARRRKKGGLGDRR